mmetsp:Transcript_11691/g.32550  ORF Transcript_11691/g.32550 Transcript_11691/m.32550 type:complete len:323 (+) Transcript_11691:660-1628(+)
MAHGRKRRGGWLRTNPRFRLSEHSPNHVRGWVPVLRRRVALLGRVHGRQQPSGLEQRHCRARGVPEGPETTGRNASSASRRVEARVAVVRKPLLHQDVRDERGRGGHGSHPRGERELVEGEHRARDRGRVPPDLAGPGGARPHALRHHGGVRAGPARGRPAGGPDDVPLHGGAARLVVVAAGGGHHPPAAVDGGRGVPRRHHALAPQPRSWSGHAVAARRAAPARRLHGRAGTPPGSPGCPMDRDVFRVLRRAGPLQHCAILRDRCHDRRVQDVRVSSLRRGKALGPARGAWRVRCIGRAIARRSPARGQRGPAQHEGGHVR